LAYTEKPKRKSDYSSCIWQNTYFKRFPLPEMWSQEYLQLFNFKGDTDLLHSTNLSPICEVYVEKIFEKNVLMKLIQILERKPNTV
jgi:hypothetical protein